MERTYVKDIKASEETTVLVKGWIHRIFDLGLYNLCSFKR